MWLWQSCGSKGMRDESREASWRIPCKVEGFCSCIMTKLTKGKTRDRVVEAINATTGKNMRDVQPLQPSDILGMLVQLQHKCIFIPSFCRQLLP